MDIKKEILRKIKKQKYLTVDEIVKLTDLTRQAVHKHFKQLITSKKVKKIGKTKSVKYVLESRLAFSFTLKVERNYSLDNLNEDRVFEELSIQYDFKHQLKNNVLDILRYAFTEVLNNAIDHSQSDKARLRLELDNYNIRIIIEDWGVGIFENIKDKHKLNDEYIALQELIKGKITTAEKYHSGEGLFFTSKAADELRIRSHKIQIIFNNVKDDVFTEKVNYKKGTLVDFVISRNSKRKLKNIFDKYSGEEFDYKFSRTSVTVNLFTNIKNIYVSRSEAKRILYNLTKFKEIILNFKGVTSIGQGFADEIFRVFKNRHPAIKVRIINVNESIEAMIKHVKKS